MNDIEGDSFKPSRGIRQGDPLSPYLFLLCSEGLSTIMRLAVESRSLRGVTICRRGPMISHLMFANGCILFEEVVERAVVVIMEGLKEHEACSRQSKGLLKSGMCWRVGSGSRISIWNDVWVPGLEDGRLHGNGLGQHYNLVSALLDQYSREWKEEIITHIMSADEASKVLSIPLSCHWLEDKQAWRGESSGEYSVQSEYKLLLAECTQEDESLEHAFRDCQAVKEIWSMLDISWPTEMSCASYKQWMDWLFMNSSSDLCRIIIYAIWVIWSDRNKHVHERKIKQNIDMVRFIVSYLKELEAIKSHLSARCVQQERWRDVSLPTNQ
ncbi:hypothetical protein Goklo_023288, partial [Gossypium klotzschianum]|nr:hypothetical protein [Gossypium klotzschianum]